MRCPIRCWPWPHGKQRSNPWLSPSRKMICGGCSLSRLVLCLMWCRHDHHPCRRCRPDYWDRPWSGHRWPFADGAPPALGGLRSLARRASSSPKRGSDGSYVQPQSGNHQSLGSELRPAEWGSGSLTSIRSANLPLAGAFSVRRAWPCAWRAEAAKVSNKGRMV